MTAKNFRFSYNHSRLYISSYKLRIKPQLWIHSAHAFPNSWAEGILDTCTSSSQDPLTFIVRALFQKHHIH
jgi:hypothetical protein